MRGALLWVRASREAQGLVLVVRRRVGNAVTRNRLRRRLRGIAREVGMVDPGLVVLAQSSAAGARYGALREEFLVLSARVGEARAP